MEPWVAVAIAVAAATALAVVVALLLVRRRRGLAPSEVPGAPEPPAARLRRGLTATRRRLAEQLDSVLRRGPRPVDVLLGELEEVLVGADVGVRTTAALLAPLRDGLGGEVDPAAVKDALRRTLRGVLEAPPAPEPAAKPWVILVTGINGVGKTTTVGKLAALHRAAGRRVLLVAADTFRAAASEQLTIWAERSGADLVRHASGADPASVVFDGLQAARARGIDVVLIDTAGRLHTRTPLMQELAKLGRVIAREIPGAPHETLLVLDATTGQNAVNQARVFSEAVSLSGVVLTKLDGTAKGGVLIAVRHELGLPIRYVGVGEGVEDLRPFDAGDFVDALFGGFD